MTPVLVGNDTHLVNVLQQYLVDPVVRPKSEYPLVMHGMHQSTPW